MTSRTNLDFQANLQLHFRHLSDVVPHIFSFIDPETYEILYINKVEPGYELKDVIGTEIFDYVLPEHVEIYREKIEEVKRTGQRSKIEIGFQSFENSEGVSWFQTTIAPVFSENGLLESILIFSEDISESKLLEIENYNKSERLKAIINNNDDMICSIDTNYRLIEFNSVLANMVKYGFKVDLKPGFRMLDYIDPRRHEHLMAIYQRVLAGEICHDIESYGTSSKGNIFLETSFHPIYSVNREITGISIFSKDITERVKNEQKIKDALREKEILLAEIHHRIKNNLAMISSMLELQELTMGSIDSREALSSSRKRIKTTALIHEMLYRNESFNEVSFKEFVTELFELLRTGDNFLVVLNGEDVTFNLTTALPLGLMLNEIMLNSFKHSYSGVSEGKTEITISSNENLLTIDYCDCQGSFPENVDFNNSNTTGLTLIHTFAEQLSGKIELVSNEPPVYKICINLDEKN